MGRAAAQGPRRGEEAIDEAVADVVVPVAVIERSGDRPGFHEAASRRRARVVFVQLFGVAFIAVCFNAQ